jgi:hypothetical protein
MQITKPENATPKKFLEDAIQKVCRDRHEEHGDYMPCHEAIANLWNAYLAGRKEPATPLGADDVALMMVLFKIGRAISGDKPLFDTYADGCGYFSIAGACAVRGS